MRDDLGKRMKENYEIRTRTFIPRRTYTIIRLDGKAFHTFTRRFNRPYDPIFANCMDETAKFLCENIQGCRFAYTQSDEISLLLTDFDKDTTDAWFDGQVQKIVSVAASMATAKFNNLIVSIELGNEPTLEQVLNIINSKSKSLAFFDARVFSIPDPIEVTNYFVWRQKDAKRNAISMHAQSLYSTSELNGMSQFDMRQMIILRGENHDKMDEGFQRGRIVRKEESANPEIIRSTWKIESSFDFVEEREKFNFPNYA